MTPAHESFIDLTILLVVLIPVVAIVVLIVSVIIVSSHRKKDEEKDAMKLFEDLENNDFENEDKK